MTKHTKGPWLHQDNLFKHDYITEEDGVSVIARIEQTPHENLTDKRPLDERMANAKLISAAPELLEALEDLWRQALQSSDLMKTEWGQEAVLKASNAINKAKGEDND